MNQVCVNHKRQIHSAEQRVLINYTKLWSSQVSDDGVQRLIHLASGSKSSVISFPRPVPEKYPEEGTILFIQCGEMLSGVGRARIFRFFTRLFASAIFCTIS
jgi:hypothetical protein